MVAVLLGLLKVTSRGVEIIVEQLDLLIIKKTIEYCNSTSVSHRYSLLRNIFSVIVEESPLTATRKRPKVSVVWNHVSFQ